MIVGFGDRLLSEVKKITPKDIKIRVCIQYSIMWNFKYNILFYQNLKGAEHLY